MPGDSNGGLLLFAARAGAALASFAANIYLANALGPTEYGRYALTIALLTFGSLFLDLGYFAAGARLLVATDIEHERRSYVGAMFAIAGILSVLFIATVLLMSTVVDHVFVDKIGRILLAIAVTAPAAIVPLVLEQALKSSGRVDLLSAWNLGAKLLFLAAITVLVHGQRLNALSACLSYTLSTLAALVLVTIPARPNFSTAAAYVRRIAVEQRRFGRPLYVGRMANLASYNTDKLLLAYFQGATAVGYYSLAMSFASAVSMFSQSVAASQFREFASLRPISHRLLKGNLSGIALVAGATLIGAQVIVRWYLGPSYALVGLLTVLAVIATSLQGAYQPYNSWLLANGFGTELREFLVRNAVINLAANLVLIPSAGPVGAAIASDIGMGTYLVQARQHYRRKVPLSE